MPKKCCGFCAHYALLGEGVTEYRGGIPNIGFCPLHGESAEQFDLLVATKQYQGNWDEAYRWDSHSPCNEFLLDEDTYNELSVHNQWLRLL